jgi:hypothetical protein
MAGKRYRLNFPKIALMNRLPITIPAGGVVQLIPGPLDENWLLDVEWEGKPVVMFASDLRAHGELVGQNRNLGAFSPGGRSD